MSKLSTRIPASSGPTLAREVAGSIREPLEDVFITPRVLDKTAFDQFSSQLKGLIDQASNQRQHVQGAVTAAEAVLKQFAQIGPLFEAKLTGATKALATVEAKASELAALAKKVEDRHAAAQQLESRIDSILTQKLADFEQRLGARLQETTQTLDRAKGELATRATALQEGLASAVEQSQDRVSALAKTVELQLADKRKEIESHTSELESRLTRISDDMSRYAGPGLTALTGLCDRAEKLLGGIGGAPQDPNSNADPSTPRQGSAAAILKDLQDLTDRSRAGLDQAKRDVESLVQQADIASGTLSGAINTAAPRIDELTTRLERVTNGLQHLQNSADSLERRREQIKATMLEALELAESVQGAVKEQLASSKQQIAHEVDIMRETLAAAAMAHGQATGSASHPMAAPFDTALAGSSPSPIAEPTREDLAAGANTLARTRVPIHIEEPKPVIQGHPRRG